MKVTITQEGGLTLAKAVRLSDEEFNKFRDVIRHSVSGARFDRAVKANVVPPERVALLVEELTGAGFEVVTPKPRRQAETAIERWAADGILIVADDDPDMARERNNVGFSKNDGDFGHRLAERIQAGAGLTDGEWGAVLRLARKYRKQIGPLPE